MNELLTISFEEEQPTVSARDLHEALEIGTTFRTWIVRMIEYGFEDVRDFQRVYQKCSTLGGEQEMLDYQLSIDMAKQICMIQRTDKGKQCRQYFIDLEKAWNTPEQIMARALKVADRRMKELNLQLVEAKPKIEFFDTVANSKTALPMDRVAKVLDMGIGRNKLFEILRDKKILDRSNIPYQTYVDRGYFRVVEQKYTKPTGETVVTTKTLVYQRGVDYIRKIVA